MNRARYTERVELWVCRICDRDYQSKSSLNRHFTQCHEQPRQRALTQASSRAVVSRDEDSFECQYCYNDYSTRSNLNRHIREVHDRSPSRVNTAVRNTTQVQNNTKSYTQNVVNNYYFR